MYNSARMIGVTIGIIVGLIVAIFIIHHSLCEPEQEADYGI